MSRTWLLGVLMVAGCTRLKGEPGPTSAQFPLGIASGEASSNGALLWTSHVGPGAVRVLVWKAGEEANGPLQTVPCQPDGDGLVHQVVTGLAASTWHTYQFVETVNGEETARSELGRFRTTLADDALAPVRFGAVSCINQRYPLDPLLQAASRDDLDAFLLLGDSLYADGSKSRLDFSDVWKRALGRYPQRRLRASTSLIPTWDDHEVTNNFDAKDGLVPVGRDEYFAFQPIGRPVDDPNRVWRSVRWGKTVEFFVLDCRGERDVASGRYVSDAQLAWLEKGLTSSTATFKVILNSVPISEFPGPLFGLGKDDRWEGFPTQRTALLQFIDDQKIPGVLWISGDFHLASAGRVSRSGPGQQAIEALVGPAGQQPNVSPTYPGKPQFDFATGVNNYTIVDLDPSTRVATLRYVSGTGKILSELSYDLNAK